MNLRVAIVLLLAMFAVGCRAAIASGMTEEQANRVVVALDRHGIHAVKEPEAGGGERGTYTILVANDDVATALAVLRAEELPQRPDPGLQEVFGEPGLVPTETEERARLSAALSGELSRSIEAIEGVLDARVHVALPQSGSTLLDEAPPRPRASVLVRYRGERPPYDESAIRALVAGAVQNLDPGDVAVIGVAAPGAPAEGSGLTSLGPIAVARGSAFTLRLVLGISLGINLVLALVLAGVVMRRRRAAPETESPEGGASKD